MKSTLLMTGLLFVCCGSPFFPETGVPPEQPQQMRSTPEGVIEQLLESYETRRIELFIDLFPTDGSFQFFVAPDFFSDIGISYTEIGERDPRLLHLAGYEEFHYWSQDREINKHRKLFNEIDNFEFTVEPTLEVRTFVDSGKSFAEVLASGGELSIRDERSTRIIYYRVKMEKQVFLLQKDDEGLWVIRKWFDFSREGG